MKINGTCHEDVSTVKDDRDTWSAQQLTQTRRSTVFLTHGVRYVINTSPTRHCRIDHAMDPADSVDQE
jgi:hypothetical protein